MMKIAHKVWGLLARKIHSVHKLETPNVSQEARLQRLQSLQFETHYIKTLNNEFDQVTTGPAPEHVSRRLSKD